MIRYLIPFLLGAWPALAGLCDMDDETLLWSSCDDPRIHLRLMPEDAGPTPENALDVTGAYTATDNRKNGAPKPVGLFVRNGEIISREYVRFDGLLTVSSEGKPKLHYRRAVAADDMRLDLENPDQRKLVLERMEQSGGSLLQSHLLIIAGKVDTAPIAGAPLFTRRILFETYEGHLGLYQSPFPLTLDLAARDVARRFNPKMALNLDMGSYDYCRKGASQCGVLTDGETAKLSNLIRLMN
ncbi:MAG: hypothetical protein AAF401_15490 [Pseudomonadota bacterium]